MSTTGSCLCNEIQYSFTGAPEVTALCHCTDCQKWSGSGFTANSLVSRDAFKVTKGSPKSYSITGDSGKQNVHWFCANCGSSLYTELEVMPDKTCVKTGSLDKIDVEFYTKDRPAYLKAIDGADQKPAFG